MNASAHKLTSLILGGFSLLTCTMFSCHGRELRATDYGLVADGKTDDGPAIQKLLDAAHTFQNEPVTLVFPQKKTIYAATGKDRYLFSLRQRKNLTVNGNHSTFLLDPAIRFADLHGSDHVTLKQFQVDFTQSMFIESTVKSVNVNEQFIDVTSDEAAALAGPTREDGEQWFGGFVWCENGPHPKAARHFSVKHVEQLGAGIVRIHHGEGSFGKAMADTIIPGVTSFSVPRAGVAHRHGPGALVEIHDATDVTLQDIKVWGAPWFVFSIYRCEGECRFLDVDVLPKPGSGRLMSACRDAFHVTANRARLLFDHCDTLGTGDDDYNFCVLTSKIHKVISPTEIIIRQKFPIQYNPMQAGDRLLVMNAENSMVGSAKISRCIEAPLPHGKTIEPGGPCPEVTLHLEHPIAALTAGLTVWSKEAENPDTTMSHCTANFSIRMQTSLKIEHCRFRCYNVSYGMSPQQDNVEGPGPEFIHIRHTEFGVGRGSGYVAQCHGKGPLPLTRIQSTRIEDSVFHAPLRIAKARSITLHRNRWQGEVAMGEHESLDEKGNTRDGKPFTISP